MKRVVLLSLFCFAGSRLALGEAGSAAQQLLATVEQQANIFREDAAPLHLKLEFTVQIQVPTQGYLTLQWAAKDRWWRRISIGDFEEVDIRNGEKLYITRNLDYTPARVREILDLIRFEDRAEGLRVKKQRQRKEGVTQLTCLEVHGEQDHKEAHEMCLDSTSRDLLAEQWKESPDETRRQEYAEHAEFRGHRYPRSMDLLVNGSKVIKARVVDLEGAPLDETLLVPPKGAIERRKCSGLKHPVPIKTPDPAYPPSASQNRLMGDTIVAMTVLTDGSVDNVQLIGSSTRSMDEATLQTLKSWKFQPAMCGTEPVVYDLEVVVSFRLH